MERVNSFLKSILDNTDYNNAITSTKETVAINYDNLTPADQEKLTALHEEHIAAGTLVSITYRNSVTSTGGTVDTKYLNVAMQEIAKSLQKVELSVMPSAEHEAPNHNAPLKPEDPAAEEFSKHFDQWLNNHPEISDIPPLNSAQNDAHNFNTIAVPAGLPATFGRKPQGITT
jgi:hypothetical protein